MQFEPKQEVYDAITAQCLAAHAGKELLTIDELLMRLMDLEGIPMHCPYHHYIMPAALLTLAAIERDLPKETLTAWLSTAQERGKLVPGGVCGNFGACGNGVGVGIFVSILTGSTPKSTDTWKLCNEASAKALLHLAEYGGPRCCKRTAFLAAAEAVDFANSQLGLHLRIHDQILCRYHHKNAECLEDSCPFYPKAAPQANSTERTPITVPASLMPKPNGSDCACMKKPVDLSAHKGILHWNVSPGTRVTRDQVLCEGEVDKKVVEILAPCDGVLAEVLIEDECVFRAGNILGYIE